METILEFLGALNNLTPLGIIGMLGLVIFMLVKAKSVKVDMDNKVTAITDNHLHSLPEIAANMEKAVETLQRIEVKIGEEFSFIKAKLNGDKR